MRPLTDRQKSLVCDNRHLGEAFIARKVKRRLLSASDRPDVEQMIYLGIIRAAKKWHKCGGTKFTTFAWRAMNNQWKGWLKHNNTYRQRFKQSAVCDKSVYDYQKISPCEMTLFARKAKLDNNQKYVIFRLLYTPDSIKQIARSLNLTRSRIGQIRDQAIKKINSIWMLPPEVNCTNDGG